MTTKAYNIRPSIDTFLHTWQYSAAGVLIDGGTSSSLGVANFGTSQRTGVGLPKWKYLISRGIDATTPFGFSGWSLDTKMPRVTIKDVYTRNSNPNVIQGNHWFGYLNPGPSAIASLALPSSVVTACHNRVITNFIQKCIEAQSAFEAGQDLGELKATVESILHPMRGLKELTLHYLDRSKKISRRRRRTPDIQKALADSYLEYRFGWRPLALDVADGVSKIRQRFMSPWTGVSASATASYGSVTNYKLQVFNGSSIYNAYFSMTGKYTEKIVGMIANKSGPDGYRPLVNELQLDLPRFVPTIYDLIPYSWLVDYFVNIGDLITAVCFNRSDLKWCCLTSRQHWLAQLVRTEIDSSASGFKRIENTFTVDDPGQMNYKIVSRSSIAAGELIPSLEFSIPLSSRPWENIGALLSSRGATVQRAFRRTK